MKVGSHNSWSYLPVKKWWMWIIKFTAQCQDVDIVTQYNDYGVRCFDLRVQFKGNVLAVSHNRILYDITESELMKQLSWLNSKKDVIVRVLLDVRSKKRYTSPQREMFVSFCRNLENSFSDIKFWNGRNLFNGEIEYAFPWDFSCEEYYSSVRSPKLIDDWYPRWYAKRNTKKHFDAGTQAEILIFDFVNYIK